jgi:hypothetical protein
VNHSDDRPEPPSEQVIDEVTALYRDCPQWAMWLPVRGQWTAVRPASDRLPEPGLPLLWVPAAATAQELRDQMRAINAELARHRG